MIAWDKMCKSKNDGGLGLRKFSVLNKTLLAKQFRESMRTRPLSITLFAGQNMKLV